MEIFSQHQIYPSIRWLLRTDIDAFTASSKFELTKKLHDNVFYKCTNPLTENFGMEAQRV